MAMYDCLNNNNTYSNNSNRLGQCIFIIVNLKHIPYFETYYQTINNSNLHLQFLSYFNMDESNITNFIKTHIQTQMDYYLNNQSANVSLNLNDCNLIYNTAVYGGAIYVSGDKQSNAIACAVTMRYTNCSYNTCIWKFTRHAFIDFVVCVCVCLCVYVCGV